MISKNQLDIGKIYLEARNKPKLRTFLDFLLEKQKIKDFQDFETDVLLSLDTDFFLSGLIYYINKSGTTAKISAENYISDVTFFFRDIDIRYCIQNNVFKNNNEYDNFKEKANVIISSMAKSPRTNIINQGEYEHLKKSISKFCSFELIETKEKAIKQLEDYFTDCTLEVDSYNNLLSCTVTKLVLLSGMKIQNVCKLKTNEVKVDRSFIQLGKRKLFFDEELKKLLINYVECRKIILRKTKQSSKHIFITHDGEEMFVDSEHSSTRGLTNFYLGILENSKIEFLANRRRLEMIKSGMDLITIKHITGASKTTCLALQSDYNDAYDIEWKEYNFLETIETVISDNPEEGLGLENEEKIVCPNCQRKVSNTEYDWVLILRKNGVKYLVCKLCKGGAD